MIDNITITSAQYVHNAEGVNYTIQATIDGKQMIVPMDTDNIHYQAILEWVAEGNTIADAD